jgi:hypothetical protein
VSDQPDQAAELERLRAIERRVIEYRDDTALTHPSASETLVHNVALDILGEGE